MAQTAGGTYYAASSELVSSWPATSLDLANQLESRFAAKLGTLSVNAQTGTTYTLATSDPQKVITMTNAAASTVTIPTNATAAIAIGSSIEVVNLSTGVNTTVSAAGGVTFNGGPVVLSPGSSVTLVKIGTDAWMAQGQGSPGLVHIAASSFSAVTSVSINNCFTSTYDNYRVLLDITVTSDQYAQIRLRNGGADRTDSVYASHRIIADASTVSSSEVSSQNLWTALAQNSGLNGGYIEIHRPFLSTSVTTYESKSYYSVYFAQFIGAGVYDLANSNDGFTMFVASGSMTGSLRVYGYRNS